MVNVALSELQESSDGISKDWAVDKRMFRDGDSIQMP